MPCDQIYDLRLRGEPSSEGRRPESESKPKVCEQARPQLSKPKVCDQTEGLRLDGLNTFGIGR